MNLVVFAEDVDSLALKNVAKLTGAHSGHRNHVLACLDGRKRQGGGAMGRS